VPIPVDPGAHQVDVTEPGHKAWQGKTTLGGAGAKESIEIPPLETLAPETPGQPVAAAPVPAPAAAPTPAPTPISTAATRTAPAGVLARDHTVWLDEDYTLAANEQDAVRLINEERAKAGLNPVSVNLDLCRVARIKAAEMAALKTLSHDSPTYGLPTAMLKTFGIPYSRVAENVSYLGGSSAKGVVWNWMDSAAHRQNVLNPNHREIGIGFAIRNGIGYWCLLLIH